MKNDEKEVSHLLSTCREGELVFILNRNLQGIELQIAPVVQFVPVAIWIFVG